MRPGSGIIGGKVEAAWASGWYGGGRAPGPPSLVPALAQLQADTSAPGGGRGRTEILAPAVVKMTEGGTVTLECVVTEHAAAPQQFVW